ncbi:MAG: chitobiase/beta-hexosaminidase C-terminal domain-containing protein [Sediminibacterium sp.]
MTKSNKLFAFIGNALWILNPFLVFIVLFKEKLTLHIGMAWIGKFHPLFLHFPIVLSICIGLYLVFTPAGKLTKAIEQQVLLSNAFIAVIVAITGLFLSKDNTYAEDLLTQHQWGGVAIALFSWILVFVNNYSIKFQTNKILRVEVGVFLLVLVIVFTHKGGQLTHGENALSFPEDKITTTDTVTKKALDSTASIYEKAVQPILLDKCVGCHGPNKVKGNLLLDNKEHILKGGKHGSVLAIAGTSSIIERIHLPLAEEKHMPPDGKPQLPQSEIKILNDWISAGGDFNKKLMELEKTDSLYLLANSYQAPIEKTQNKGNTGPDISEYNTNYCNVQYVYPGSNLIEVNFFQGSFYDRAQLKKLDKIKAQIVSLNMQTMPLQQEDMAMIADFKQLEKLNLNYTGLKITSLASIKTLSKLKSLSIAGIEATPNEINNLIKGSSIEKLHIWNTSVKQDQVALIQSNNKKLMVTVGDNLENEIIKIINPSIEQDSSIIPAHLDIPIKHVVKGAIVRYTLDGTDPDSLKSPIYKKPIRLFNNTVLKTKAFKAGWISSDIVERNFYKSTIHPDSIVLLQLPDPKYRANGPKTLFDYELGDKNFGNAKWLGYKDANMEMIFGFKQPTAIKEIYLNALVNLGSYIFPIVSIDIMGSMDGKNYTLVSKNNYPGVTDATPKTMNETKGFSCAISKPTPYKFYKLVATNLKKLPNWHPGKGTPAWIFIDEIFLN